MSSASRQITTEQPLGFLSATELSMPKSETARKELQNLALYREWIALNEAELHALKGLVEISKSKSQIIKENPDADEKALSKLLVDVSNSERTATIDLNKARNGIDLFIKNLTQDNPFDTHHSIHGVRPNPLSTSDIMSNLDLRILINEDLKTRERDKIQIAYDAINKYDTKDQELAEATQVLADYENKVVPLLTKREDIEKALNKSISSSQEGDYGESIESSRNALASLRHAASASLDDDTKLFLRACGDQEILVNALQTKIPANPLVLSNEYLDYSMNPLSKPDPTFDRIHQAMWDKELPWTHDNKLYMERDMALAHVLHATLKRLHYLGEAYQASLDEIDQSKDSDKDTERKKASRSLWQLYRQTEYLIDSGLEERLIEGIKGKAYTQDELQELALLASLEQLADQDEFKKYNEFIRTGERLNNQAHLPSSYRIGSATLKLLEESGQTLSDSNLAILEEVKNDPIKLSSYLESKRNQNPAIADFHNRLIQEMEPYGAILSLMNLIPEVGPESAYSKTQNFSDSNIAREENLNLLYGVCMRLGELSTRLNCGPEQIGQLLQEFSSNNKGASNYEEILKYVDSFRSKFE